MADEYSPRGHNLRDEQLKFYIEYFKALFQDPSDDQWKIRTTAEISPSGLQNGGRDSYIMVPDTDWIKIERSATSNPVIGSGTKRLIPTNSMKIGNQGTETVVTTVNSDPNGDGQTTDLGDPILPDDAQFMDLKEANKANQDINIWVRSTNGTQKVFFRELG